MSAKETGLPCIKCDSSDAMARYEDGTGYCFSCKTHFKVKDFNADTPPWESGSMAKETSSGDNPSATLPPADVPSRGLDKQTLEYYGVGVGFSETSGEPAELHFPVYRKGKQTGTKFKVLETKTYAASGNVKGPDLFGSWKCKEGGRLLIITEGEEDCMSAHQLLRNAGKEYNVVSLPNGANAAAVRNNLEWVESFDSVVLNLDNDDVGEATAKEIADLLTPGKVRLMTLPVKDANDFLRAKHSGQEYLTQLNRAKYYQPDGIVNMADLWEIMTDDTEADSIPYPWAGLNKKLYGLRERELVTFTSGTGMGKSAVMRELEHHLLMNTDDNIGILALEEGLSRTGWGVVSVEAGLNLSIREERKAAIANGLISEEELHAAFQRTLGTGRLHTLDHWGSTAEKKLFSRIRYLIRGLECKWIILDHLNIVVSGMDESGDERRAIDSIMTKLRSLCEETGAGMLLVCHLRRMQGDKGHEQGGEISLAHLRGSQAIAQLSDGVIGLERDQQALNDKVRNLTKVRVLKNRYAGLTGLATHLSYDNSTGRLSEIDNVDEYLAPPVSEFGV